MLQSVIGLVAFVGTALWLSENRRRVSWRLAAAGLGLQLVLGAVLIKFSFAQLRSILAGTLATCMTEAIVGIFMQG